MSSKVKYFDKALEWIKNNTIEHKTGGNGIAVTDKNHQIYPEVTGYYIPSLLEWGEKSLALSYAEYLVGVQQSDGSWLDSRGEAPYIFDSCQILKGLLAVYPLKREYKSAILKGCDWVLTNMQEDGRLTTPTEEAWGSDPNFCSELIHLYCLSPLAEAAEIFHKPGYKEAALKIKEYYITNYRDKITRFSLLSHFYAYVLEGLVDLGETDLVKEALSNTEKFQSSNGMFPALNDVKWVCSTGMFQLAIVLFKLGNFEKGDRIFEAALSLQNKSGGWYGSYSRGILSRALRLRKYRAYYFPDQEISWAVKFFLDALAWREKLDFDRQAPTFLNQIDKGDERYTLIRDRLADKCKCGGDVCDIGCGKGRYLRNLLEDLPRNSYSCADLSEQVMKTIPQSVKKYSGRMTNLPFQNDAFDFVYVCEAFEHAVNQEGAFGELARITKPGGEFIIVDKPIEKLGTLKLDPWEKWLDTRKLAALAKASDCKMQVVTDLKYDGARKDGLFNAWIFTRD